MEKLAVWIKKHEKMKDFLESVKMSRSYFSEWKNGKKRISLQIASRIVQHTDKEITFEDLVDFENSCKNGKYLQS